MNPWIEVAKSLPPENQVVNTKIEENGKVRNEQHLQRNGKLWWTTDGKMYVYYTPTHWRLI